MRMTEHQVVDWHHTLIRWTNELSDAAETWIQIHEMTLMEMRFLRFCVSEMCE